MDHVEITAGRLHLRPWQPADAPAVHAACQDPDIQRRTSVPVPYEPQDARDYVERQSPEGWATGSAAMFAVLDSTDGRLLASVQLERIEDGKAELGFWCAPAERGRGVLVEAVGVVCRWGFAALGLERITWYAEVGNLASRRIAERNGFTVEGTLRSYYSVRTGGRTDVWAGARLATDPDRDTRVLPPWPGASDGTVALRHWEPGDVDAWLRGSSDPGTQRFVPVSSARTVEDGERFVQAAALQWATGERALLAATDAVTGEVLGLMGMVGRNLRGASAEIGWWTLPEARGRGVAPRAARLLTRWLLTDAGFPRVEALVDVDNAASQRAAEKAGLRREGVLRAAGSDPLTGVRRDMVVFATTATDLSGAEVAPTT